MNKNEFFGINCACWKEEAPNYCQHSAFPGMSHVLKILDSLYTSKENAISPLYDKWLEE